MAQRVKLGIKAKGPCASTGHGVMASRAYRGQEEPGNDVNSPHGPAIYTLLA